MNDISLDVINKSIRNIRMICHIAWKLGMMSGWSGNASLRLNIDKILITGAGTSKGNLESENLLLIDSKGDILAGEGLPSSESALHLELYKAIPNCEAILHTHPPYLQALEILMRKLKFPQDEFLNISLYESNLWRPRLFFAKEFAPGSAELAQSASGAICRYASDLSLPCAIWLPNHGLCALARNLSDALCLTEEMEHLAKVQCVTLAL